MADGVNDDGELNFTIEPVRGLFTADRIRGPSGETSSVIVTCGARYVPRLPASMPLRAVPSNASAPPLTSERMPDNVNDNGGERFTFDAVPGMPGTTITAERVRSPSGEMSTVIVACGARPVRLLPVSIPFCGVQSSAIAPPLSAFVEK